MFYVNKLIKIFVSIKFHNISNQIFNKILDLLFLHFWICLFLDMISWILTSFAHNMSLSNQMNKKLISQKMNILLLLLLWIFTTDQSCSHAVLKSNKHAEKSEKSKNLHLNLLYIYCDFSAVCSNYLTSAMSTSFNLSFLNSC